MRKFIMSLTTVASLSLAAVPVLGLTQAANAAEGEHSVRVAYGDLNLANPGHAKIFKARIETAANAFCRTTLDAGDLRTTMRDCVNAVRREVDRQLPTAQHQALAMAAHSEATEMAAR
ncbi:UrcA family protein [Caulobacter sp. RL271]|jgi:UrcA family protein|uniref:UrcA family protein n=1 Tax=Caulobacter segnis TaxID=88688 RepID=A0ABY4ZWG5_9CAUL|nr:UrcA family protein [Caulobacter segnis]USQ96820.1 UrcA family protein [Caulobacter segnis]